MKLYHGSPIKGITEFNLNHPRYENPFEGNAIYLTYHLDSAKSYAGDDGSVYEVKISDNIFDATSKDTLITCLKDTTENLKNNILNHPEIQNAIEMIIKGAYRVFEGNSAGLSWIVSNLLINDEKFNVSNPNALEIIETIRENINDYLNQFDGIKYYDKNIGIVIAIKKPKIIQIVKEILSKDIPEN